MTAMPHEHRDTTKFYTPARKNLSVVWIGTKRNFYITLIGNSYIVQINPIVRLSIFPLKGPAGRVVLRIYDCNTSFQHACQVIDHKPDICEMGDIVRQASIFVEKLTQKSKKR